MRCGNETIRKTNGVWTCWECWRLHNPGMGTDYRADPVEGSDTGHYQYARCDRPKRS